jgi:aspartyl aminopeptidase
MTKRLKRNSSLLFLSILNKEYGIIEEDFSFAEIEMVPAGKPTDIGFDKSLIAAYGQDDKVCAFTSLQAIKKLNLLSTLPFF